MTPTPSTIRTPLDRAAAETLSGGADGSSATTSYAYDLAGNRLTQTTSAGGAASSRAYSYLPGTDRLASVSSGDTAFSLIYSHDAAGCITSIVSTTSSVGSDLRADRTLTWNALYQLTSVSTNGVPAESYTYDALGRRISTTTTEGTLFHVYDDNWQCLADVNGQGDVVASYVWGPGIDNLLAVAVPSGGGASPPGEPCVYYALTDHQNTVHGFADTNGTVVVRYAYDAWGNLLSEECSVPALASNRYRFQGREYSTVTGLYNFRARWYDPENGCWLSKDPIGLAGGLNLYAFCGNEPINLLDPLGLTFLGFSGEEWLGIGNAFMEGLSRGAQGIVNSLSGGLFDPTAGLFYDEFNKQWEDIGRDSNECNKGFSAGTNAGRVYVGLMLVYGYATGIEITIGPNIRIAPFGNRSNNPLGRRPHYHRRGVDADGNTIPGQGIGRHRPWETKATDQSWLDRF